MCAAWRRSCGIDSGSRGANSAGPTDSYRSITLQFRWVPTANAQVQCQHQLQMDSRTGQGWIYVFQNQQILLNSTFSVFNLLAYTSVGNGMVTVSLTDWQIGKWDRLPWCIWPSHRRSFIWNTFTESRISVIGCFRPWSFTLRGLRCSVMSHKNDKSLSHFSSSSSGMTWEIPALWMWHLNS